MNQNHFFMALFALVLYWVVTIYQPFLLTIAIAGLLAIATATLHRYIYKQTRNEILSSALITILMAIILFGPIIYFIASITPIVKYLNPELISKIIEKSMNLLDNIPQSLQFLEPKIREFVKEIEITTMSKDLIAIFGNIGAKSAIFIKDIILIVIFFFFAHLYGKKILRYLTNNLPFEKAKAKILFNETSSVMSVTTYSIIITAVFQGILFAIAVFFLGYDPILFGILYGFASLIPIIGGIIMWLPVALFEFYLGNTGNAIFISVYTIVVISIVADTFIKPIIIEFVSKKVVGLPMKVNSLIIFFAIVAGLSTHGFWGMILGPAVTALFVAMISVANSMKSKN